MKFMFELLSIKYVSKLILELFGRIVGLALKNVCAFALRLGKKDLCTAMPLTTKEVQHDTTHYICYQRCHI